jgi:hypothetical protein
VRYQTHDADRADFDEVLVSLGYTPETVQVEVENEDDQMELPEGMYKVKIGVSPIQGRGVIATAPIEAGEAIGFSKVGFFRTPLGRFTNHSKEPNGEMQQVGENYLLVATKDVQTDDEITVDYRAVIQLLRG